MSQSTIELAGRSMRPTNPATFSTHLSSKEGTMSNTVFSKFFHHIGVILLLATTGAGVAHAQAVGVQDAWARTTVPGQKATGAFMTLTARDGSRLVGAASPVAGVTQVHEMKMEGDVMKMRALKEGLELPAGKAIELKPGSFHIMLMDLKVALPRDSTIPLTLTFRDAKGQHSTLELKVPVATSAPDGKRQTSVPHESHKH
jgi:copper(I)-binding protein